MAKKKDLKSKTQLLSDADTLATVREMQMNYLSNNSDKALKRIQEVKEEVEVETKAIRKNTKTKEAIKKEAKELDKALKAIKKSKENEGFEVVTDKKGETFLKAGKKKVKLDADALWNINNQEQVKVEKPKKETKKKKNPSAASNKLKKEPKKKEKKEDPALWDKKSFSFSKDRLNDVLKDEVADTSSLMMREFTLVELEQKIKSIYKLPALYRFSKQQVVILKNNLALKLKGQPPSKTCKFVTDTLMEILNDSKRADETAEKKAQLKRLKTFIRNVENKVLTDKELPEAESLFLTNILSIVYNTLAQDIKISTSLRGKISKLNFSDSFDTALETVKSINPFVGFLAEAASNAIAKTGKFAGKIFGDDAKELIDSDLENIFDYRESERAGSITMANRKAMGGKGKMGGYGGYGGYDDYGTGGGFDDFDDLYTGMPDTMDQLVLDQEKQTEVLGEILDTLDETKKTSDELLIQNKEWKKEDQIKLSKDRVKAENQEYLKPFSGSFQKPEKKDKNFLSNMFGADSKTGIGVSDIFQGTLLTKVFSGSMKTIGKFAGSALKTIGTFMFSKFIPGLFRMGIGLIGRAIALSAGALLTAPAAMTAAAIGATVLAYSYRDEIWSILKTLFNTIQSPIKKAIEWVADKLIGIKDVIFSKGLELFTNAKDFFKKTFGYFETDDTSLERDLANLQREFEREKLIAAETSMYLQKNKLPITTEIKGSNLISRNQKIASLKEKIETTRGAIASAPSSIPNLKNPASGSEIPKKDSSGKITKINDNTKSYGSFQLSSNSGLNEFIRESGYSSQLGNYQPGTPEFDRAWESIAQSDPNFGEAQKAFVQGRAPETAKAAPTVSPTTSSKIGSLTAMSESGNNAGIISTGKGDFGGKSYGTYQLASNTGTLNEFMKSSGYDSQLSQYPVGSPEFDAAWKNLAKTDPNFAKAQQDFIQSTHYDPMVQNLAKSGIDVSNRGDALKEVIFSTATQYGPNSGVIKKALADKDTSNMSDEELISHIQDYKLNNVDSTHKSSSEGVRAGVSNRIVREKNEMLAKARNDKLLQGGRDKEIQTASNNVTNNNVMTSNSGSSGSAGSAGNSSTRNSESTMTMLQMHMMRGTPMG